MLFCTNCGTQLKPDIKFCDNCGTPVPTAAQEQQAEQASPRQVSYTPPVQEGQGSYTPSAQQAQGSYAPPAQQAQGSYAPPMQQAQGGYAPPVPVQQYSAQAAYAAPQAAPKQKKPIDKRLLLFGGIGVAVVVIGIILALVLGGKGDQVAAAADSNLGIYNAVSAEMWDMEMTVSDFWENGFSIELMENGKCSMVIDGNKGSGKWCARYEKHRGQHTQQPTLRRPLPVLERRARFSRLPGGSAGTACRYLCCGRRGCAAGRGTPLFPLYREGLADAI